MCDILGLKPNANNGTWSNVAEMLVKTDPSAGRSTTVSFILFMISVTTSTLKFLSCQH